MRIFLIFVVLGGAFFGFKRWKSYRDTTQDRTMVPSNDGGNNDMNNQGFEIPEFPVRQTETVPTHDLEFETEPELRSIT